MYKPASMIAAICRLATAALVATSVSMPFPVLAQSTSSLVARGAYLVNLGSCEHCHTPGHFLGQRDQTKKLAGSDVGFQVPMQGTVVGPNITPSKETGIGNWTRPEIVHALRTGERPDGRILSTIMPWPELAKVKTQDLEAIAAYLQSLPPIENHTPGPFGEGEPIPIPTLRVVPPEIQ
ncbi:c-type cytochrome [Pseudorhizobium marinum]|uniref:c-type cytochrome n=1 Tax=Pseudorhizobium marinum TaxID=1496690 RepID=UPI001F19B2BE|nr:cytochrome c [Pseudorhizobium marinum]